MGLVRAFMRRGDWSGVVECLVRKMGKWGGQDYWKLGGLMEVRDG